MYRWLESRVLWGSFLILAGLLFLLQNVFNLPLGWLFWAALLTLGGLVFISVYLNNRRHWWALIPGFTLLGVAVTVFISNFFPQLDDISGGLFVLGGIGLAFATVYLADRRNWWAIIPAGVMFTLAVISVLDQLLIGFDTGSLLFLGLALTFVGVALLPNPQGQMKWAWYPAVVLAVIGLIIAASSQNLLRFLGPLILILGGLAVIYRTLIARRG
jgi:hypothetical protein